MGPVCAARPPPFRAFRLPGTNTEKTGETWAKGGREIAVLRAASGPGGGFILPPEQIVPTGEENMAGFVVYSERVLQGWKEGLLPRNATHAR